MLDGRAFLDKLSIHAFTLTANMHFFDVSIPVMPVCSLIFRAGLLCEQLYKPQAGCACYKPGAHNTEWLTVAKV